MTRRDNSTLPKYINGEKLTQEQFRRRVARTVALAGEDGANTDFIVQSWGDSTWAAPDNRVILSNTLRNLVERGLAHKLGRGRYLVDSRQLETQGTVISEATERQIVLFMKKQGGFAYWYEILREYGLEPGSDDALLTTLKRVVSSSEDIRFGFRDHAKRGQRGVYFLAPPLLATLPLRGCWFRILYEARWHGWMEHVRDMGAMEFTRVAMPVFLAFEHGHRTMDEALADPDVAKAMEEFAANYTTHLEYRREIESIDQDYDLIKGKVALNMRVRGLSDLEILEEREKELARHKFNLPSILLDKFAMGREEAHDVAPLSFYYAIGKFLNLDPAQLSRGVSQLLNMENT